MKTLLVIPPNHTSRFSFPQLGIMYLGTVLRCDGRDVSIVDCQNLPNASDEVVRRARGFDTVGFYANYFSSAFARDAALAVKRESPEKLILLGGPIANYKPEFFVRGYADAVVLGEGEPPIVRIAAGEPLSQIPSVVSRNGNGEIVSGGAAGAPVDLDSLPFPDWNLIDYRKFSYTIGNRRPIVTMMTSRGCSFNCVYCTKLIFGREVRRRSVDSVIGEIENNASKFGVKEIHFVDDDLTGDMPRFKQTCEELIRRGHGKRVAFGTPNAIRPDRGDDDMFRLMVRAGFYFVIMSIESADPEVSAKLGRNADVGKFKDNIRAARKAGLIVSTFYIMGAPFDTIKSIRASQEFAWSSAANTMTIFFFVPFPGTRLYDLLVKQGKIAPESPDVFSGTSLISMTPQYEANDWTAADLTRMARATYRRFYLSPKRALINLRTFATSFSNLKILISMFLRLVLRGNPVFEEKPTVPKAARQATPNPPRQPSL